MKAPTFFNHFKETTAKFEINGITSGVLGLIGAALSLTALLTKNESSNLILLGCGMIALITLVTGVNALNKHHALENSILGIIGAKIGLTFTISFYLIALVSASAILFDVPS